MDTKTILNDATARMQKAVDFLEESLANIRAGKASVNVLNGVFVDYYGSQTPVSGVEHWSYTFEQWREHSFVYAATHRGATQGVGKAV